MTNCSGEYVTNRLPGLLRGCSISLLKARQGSYEEPVPTNSYGTSTSGVSKVGPLGVSHVNRSRCALVKSLNNKRSIFTWSY